MEATLDKLKIIGGREGFNEIMLEKDYLITRLLYLIKDVEGIYFKGGTALHKIFFNHQRLSEDLDFAATRSVRKIVDDIKSALKRSIFEEIGFGKDVDGFTRVIIKYKLFHEEGKIFIDLNERGRILLEPKKYKIIHFYEEFIPKFKVKCLDKREIISEKFMAAATRYRPRDYVDLYFLVKNKIPFNKVIIKKKFLLNKLKFSSDMIFENTNKVFIRWDNDLSQILKEPLDFKKVMEVLKKHFKYRLKKVKKQN
ncbi:MAG: nucleotidyl transferase AbiEii/AbiGii toxin family protein [Candidatus Aenigmarchaeota archaeon]|nr:nucleotidyl transferase AbiEii/AbiGii toxin family protein [Candidatus Aenigmarchaeota archaeon]